MALAVLQVAWEPMGWKVFSESPWMTLHGGQSHSKIYLKHIRFWCLHAGLFSMVTNKSVSHVRCTSKYCPLMGYQSFQITPRLELQVLPLSVEVILPNMIAICLVSTICESFHR